MDLRLLRRTDKVTDTMPAAGCRRPRFTTDAESTGTRLWVLWAPLRHIPFSPARLPHMPPPLFAQFQPSGLKPLVEAGFQRWALPEGSPMASAVLRFRWKPVVLRQASAQADNLIKTCAAEKSGPPGMALPASFLPSAVNPRFKSMRSGIGRTSPAFIQEPAQSLPRFPQYRRSCGRAKETRFHKAKARSTPHPPTPHGRNA